MKRYRITIEPRSAFGTPLKGDTLFGQLCWAVLNRYGEDRLQVLLRDYLKQPFLVCSDGFPHGYVPRPSVPGAYFNVSGGEDRKVIRKKRWVPLADLNRPMSEWLVNAQPDDEVLGKYHRERPEQPHNTINRLTGTTGKDMFAPYTQPQSWYKSEVKIDLYLLLDESRLAPAELEALLEDLGTFGYGRDASIGLGKFNILDCVEKWNFPDADKANACLTLAPCAPQGQGLDGQPSFYQVFTRFGRHGDRGVHKPGGPFKTPVLLADTGAVFSPVPNARDYIGQGLGGEGQLSKTIPATVHQGYAPYIPFHLPLPGQEEAA